MIALLYCTVHQITFTATCASVLFHQLISGSLNSSDSFRSTYAYTCEIYTEYRSVHLHFVVENTAF